MNKVYLPNTKFNLYIKEKESEKEILNYWNSINLQEMRTQKRKDAKAFVLHDGPPYANGAIHIGHAENKFWKDALNKFFWQQGYATPYIPGWDAHGLPIENAVEKQLKKDGIDKRTLNRQEFWDKCYNFAYSWMEKQQEQFKNLGVFADYENRYATFFEKESVGIVKCIHDFVEAKLLRQKYKPVLWSIAEKTALAYAEVEYQEKTSNSIYVKFAVEKTDLSFLENVNFIVWTTTPWTLPANETVAYNEKFEYIVFEADNEKYCTEKGLFVQIESKFSETKILHEFKGAQLSNTFVLHPISEFNTKKRKLVHSAHVDDEKGTGFVHIAPAHGEEDFQLAKNVGLNIEDLLDKDGYFKEHVPLVGQKNVKEAEKIVMENLGNSLIYHETFVHSYPHSWRSKAPLIYRLTKQWFLEISSLKEKAIQALQDTLKWIPQEGENRFVPMLQAREDWCISRQRIWGVPIAIFYNINTGEVKNDATFLKKIREKLQEIGVKNWWNLQISDIDSSYNDKDWQRVNDIVDIWFESGATQSFLLQEKNMHPADVYLEGTDQHRGWFQSSLLISAFQTGRAPWKNLITHGFCLDGSKKKMSKSLGNVVDPASWGSDALRVLFASFNLCNDISMHEGSIKNANEMLFRFRNTIKFMLGMLSHEETATCENLNYEALPVLEKWLLHRLHQVNEEFCAIKENFKLNGFLDAVYEFCSQDLSAFYFDIRKDTLYCEEKTSETRVAAINCIKIILPALIKMLAPIAPFVAEEAWHIYLEENDLEKSSVHMQDAVQIDYKNEKAAKELDGLRETRKQITEKMEKLREDKVLKTTQEASVLVPEDLFHEDLKAIAMVAKISTHSSSEIIVQKMDGKKCSRCRFLCEDVLEELCVRCIQANALCEI